MSFCTCERCDREFKTRGLILHQRKCLSQMEILPVSLPRSDYKFCIINSDVFPISCRFLEIKH